MSNPEAIQPVSFEEHQEAKRLARERDWADIKSGRRTLQEVVEANGGIGKLVQPGSMRLVRRSKRIPGATGG